MPLWINNFFKDKRNEQKFNEIYLKTLKTYIDNNLLNKIKVEI